MCRLFFQYNIINNALQNKENILNFLENETLRNPDGYGFSWFNNVTNKWSVYKNCILYKEDEEFTTKINDIVNSNIIVGHVRSNNHKDFLNNDIYNSHPFIYENQIFCHNGGTRKPPNFSIYNSIKSKIDKKYLPFINGFTTSELLFYLFLTIKDDVIESKTFTEYDEILLESFNLMITYLEYLPLKVFANIIFADETYVIITKYKTHNLYSEEIKSLFYKKTDNCILASSSSIFYSMEEFTDNSIMLINIKTGNKTQHPIICV
jgi:predicted glutamine amidotransferase